jgi:hypothetical protein
MMLKQFVAAPIVVLVGYLLFVEVQNVVTLVQSGFPFPLEGLYALLLNAACLGFALWLLIEEGKGFAKRVRSRGRG